MQAKQKQTCQWHGHYIFLDKPNSKFNEFRSLSYCKANPNPWKSSRHNSQFSLDTAERSNLFWICDNFLSLFCVSVVAS